MSATSKILRGKVGVQTLQKGMAKAHRAGDVEAYEHLARHEEELRESVNKEIRRRA